MRIPIEALIEQERRREREKSSFEQPRLEAPRPMPMYRDETPAPSRRGDTSIDIGGEEEEESDRGVVIISIWDD